MRADGGGGLTRDRYLVEAYYLRASPHCLCRPVKETDLPFLSGVDFPAAISLVDRLHKGKYQ